jgi:hypothetical protein
MPPFEPALDVGEVLNVSGRVRVRAAGRTELLVGSASDVLRAATLGLGASADGPDRGHAYLEGTSADALPGMPDTATLATAPGGAPPPPLLVIMTGLAAIVAVALLSASVLTLLWPRIAQRLHERAGDGRGDLVGGAKEP